MGSAVALAFAVLLAGEPPSPPTGRATGRPQGAAVDAQVGMAMAEADGRVIMEPVEPEGGPVESGPWEDEVPGEVMGDLVGQLAPFGDWYDSPLYGYVWRPSPAAVGAAFMPFSTGGFWVRAGEGWSFESPWEWGSIVFHYGRWAHEPDLGWVWMPTAVRVVFGPHAPSTPPPTYAPPPLGRLHVVRIPHPPGIEFAAGPAWSETALPAAPSEPGPASTAPVAGGVWGAPALFAPWRGPAAAARRGGLARPGAPSSPRDRGGRRQP